jgi:hypothetical protein
MPADGIAAAAEEEEPPGTAENEAAAGDEQVGAIDTEHCESIAPSLVVVASAAVVAVAHIAEQAAHIRLNQTVPISAAEEPMAPK